MKRCLAALALAVLLCLPLTACQKQQNLYSATWFDLFDTVAIVQGYATGQDEWNIQAAAVQEDLSRYNELFDIYNHYDDVVNLYDVKLRAVADGDLGGIVGDLCAGKPAPAFAPLIAVPDRPAIIISGLRHDNGELGAFLDLVKMGGASIPVRSMVTPTSKHWTLANLLFELNTEHETVQGDKA